MCIISLLSSAQILQHFGSLLLKSMNKCYYYLINNQQNREEKLFPAKNKF